MNCLLYVNVVGTYRTASHVMSVHDHTYVHVQYIGREACETLP